MINGIVILTLIVAVAVAAFTLAMSSYYHSSVRSGLRSKAQTASDMFTTYVSSTYAEYYQSAYRYTEAFEDKDILELQFINTRGQVEISSYGVTSGSRPDTQDIIDALETGEISDWSGRSAETGERILAVSSPLLYQDGQVIGLMRYVTSLKLVDRQVLSVLFIAGGVGLGVILIVALSNLYFLRTVTGPIQELTGMAKRIADGSYGIRLKKKYDDEIGVLTDTINEMSEKLASAEKLQTEFISSVSHELRTPLTAITGWSETLMYDEAIQGDSRRGIQIISKEASRLTKMVVELLEFTRIQDGRFNLNVEKLDIAAEVEDIVFTYGNLLRQDNIQLHYTPPEEDLPPILGDAERLKQVFLNILDNAAKYGREGKRIEVVLRSGTDSVTVTVRDYGPGIPENELPFVKQKFYKGSSKERGSGIGLAVCEEIVTRHKGTLTVENAPEKGVLVTVELPVFRE